MFRDYIDVVNFPTCTGACYLDTKVMLSGASATNAPVLKGQGSNSPTYAIIHKEGNTGDFSVKYWFFFPYNRGKRVCVGMKMWGSCVGGYSTFGSHVGDWEHIQVRFRNYNIHSLYLAAHDFGGWYNWDGTTFKKGSDSISMVGGHPVAYSAYGSHGMWSTAGSHTYKDLGIDKLVDVCSAGADWETWKNLKIVDYKARGQFTGQFSFMNFHGRWGNNKAGCNPTIGQCIRNGGPYGPPK